VQNAKVLLEAGLEPAILGFLWLLRIRPMH